VSLLPDDQARRVKPAPLAFYGDRDYEGDGGKLDPGQLYRPQALLSFPEQAGDHLNHAAVEEQRTEVEHPAEFRAVGAHDRVRVVPPDDAMRSHVRLDRVEEIVWGRPLARHDVIRTRRDYRRGTSLVNNTTQLRHNHGHAGE
jgi:hypothetical protein